MEMNGDGAKRLGEKLLMEVEVEDLSSLFKSLREFMVQEDGITNNTNTAQPSHFNIPEVDRLMLNSSSPILEIISPPPTHHASGAGKTSLIYLIIAHAILPRSLSSTPLSGQESAIILFDPLHHFSIPRLVQVMLTLLKTHLSTTSHPLTTTLQASMKITIKTALPHLHIFHPTSWSTLLSTLDTLPAYLLNPNPQHKSRHRRIHSLMLEDIDAFVWSIRNTSTTVSTSSNTLATASAQLTGRVAKLGKLFSCATVLTSESNLLSSYRPALPTSWPQGTPVTRLAVRRVDVLKFAPGISVEDAEKERAQRWEVVSRGRFECWRVGVGARDGEGFVFRVGKGVEVEREGGR